MISIGIVDYSIGNLCSVQRACDYLGVKHSLVSNPKLISRHDAIILPGVGAFKPSMEDLTTSGLAQALTEFSNTGKPLYGICLGMQLLLNSSSEFGFTKGLSLIDGEVRSFKDQSSPLTYPVPKTCWDNLIKPPQGWNNSPLENFTENDDFYFTHSMYCSVNSEKNVLSLSTYNKIEYASSIMKENIFATQFHPEKSGKVGLKLYKSWIDFYFK